MPDKKIDYRKKLQTIINTMKFCWLCGRDDQLTNHHVIPQRLKGVKMNITVPVCHNCQKILHSNDEFLALLRRLVL